MHHKLKPKPTQKYNNIISLFRVRVRKHSIGQVNMIINSVASAKQFSPLQISTFNTSYLQKSVSICIIFLQSAQGSISRHCSESFSAKTFLRNF